MLKLLSIYLNDDSVGLTYSGDYSVNIGGRNLTVIDEKNIQVNLNSDILDGMYFINCGYYRYIFAYDPKGVFGDNIYVVNTDVFPTEMDLYKNYISILESYVKEREISDTKYTPLQGFDYYYRDENSMNFTTLVKDKNRVLYLRTIKIFKSGSYKTDYQKIYQLESELEDYEFSESVVDDGFDSSCFLWGFGVDKSFLLGDGIRKGVNISCEDSEVFMDITVDSKGKVLISRIEDTPNNSWWG